MLVYFGPYRGEHIEDVPSYELERWPEEIYPGTPLARQQLKAAEEELKRRKERDEI